MAQNSSYGTHCKFALMEMPKNFANASVSSGLTLANISLH